MRRFSVVILSFLFCFSLLLLVGACGKRPQATTPSTDPPATRSEVPSQPDILAPSVTISASPSTITPGQQTTLSWQSTDTSSLIIDGDVGLVAASGSMAVSPLASTTYTATATGPGGEARSSTRVTVTGGSTAASVRSTDIDSLRKAIDEGKVQPVFFGYDKAELSAAAKRTLEENARWFSQFREVTLIIQGHCDERGTDEYNLALGDRRAQITKDYLVSLGISRARLETLSYGEERPFVEGRDESAWRLNRRAHFVLGALIAYR